MPDTKTHPTTLDETGLSQAGTATGGGRSAGRVAGLLAAGATAAARGRDVVVTWSGEHSLALQLGGALAGGIAGAALARASGLSVEPAAFKAMDRAGRLLDRAADVSGDMLGAVKPLTIIGASLLGTKAGSGLARFLVHRAGPSASTAAGEAESPELEGWRQRLRDWAAGHRNATAPAPAGPVDR